MTRPVRQIIAKDLSNKFLSITEDENRLTARILLPVDCFPKEKRLLVKEEDFYSTQELRHCYVELDNNVFFIFATGCFDKTSRLGKLWWEPGANIEFFTNAERKERGEIFVISKHRCYTNTLERSTELTKRLGVQAVCQVFCRSSSESIIEAAKSFTTDELGKTYTNIDVSRLVPMTAEELMANPKASYFLVTHPIIQVPPTVNPYEPFAGRVTLIRGEDGQVATECSGDFWFIDSDSGYLPKKRVRVEKGVGYFWARALDLEDGDVMEFTVADLAGHICGRTETIVKEI